MDTFKEKFLAVTYTIAAAHQRLGTLRHILETVWYAEDTTVSLNDRYKTAVLTLPKSDRHFFEELGVDFLSQITQENLHRYITDWQEWIDNLPTLIIYVPVQFEDEQIINLGQWCRAEVTQSVLLDLVIEPAVVGGCAFIKNHTYHDFSLRARLAEDRQVIPAIVTKYESV